MAIFHAGRLRKDIRTNKKSHENSHVLTYGEKHHQHMKLLHQQHVPPQSKAADDETLLESFGEKYEKLVEDSKDHDKSVGTNDQSPPRNTTCQHALSSIQGGDGDGDGTGDSRSSAQCSPTSRGLRMETSSPVSTSCKKCAHHHQCYNKKMVQATILEDGMRSQQIVATEHDEGTQREQVSGQIYENANPVLPVVGSTSSNLRENSPISRTPKFLRESKVHSSPSSASSWKKNSSERSPSYKRRLEERWTERHSPNIKKKRFEERWTERLSPKSKKKRFEERLNEEHLSLRFGDGPLTDCKVCRHHHGIRDHPSPPISDKAKQLALLRAGMKNGDLWWAVTDGGKRRYSSGCKRCLLHHLHSERALISEGEEAARYRNEKILKQTLKSRDTRRNYFSSQSPTRSPRWSPSSPSGRSRPNSSYISNYKYRSCVPFTKYYNEGTTRLRSPSPLFSSSLPRARKDAMFANRQQALRRKLNDVLHANEENPFGLPKYRRRNVHQRKDVHESDFHYPQENFGLYAKDVMNKARRFRNQNFGYEDDQLDDQLWGHKDPRFRLDWEESRGIRSRKHNNINSSKPTKFDVAKNDRHDAASSRFQSPRWSRECLHTRDVLQKLLHSREAMKDISARFGQGDLYTFTRGNELNSRAFGAKKQSPMKCPCEEILLQLGKDFRQTEPLNKDSPDTTPKKRSEARSRQPLPGRENLSPNKGIRSSPTTDSKSHRGRVGRQSSPNRDRKIAGLDKEEKIGEVLKEDDESYGAPASSCRQNHSEKKELFPEAHKQSDNKVESCKLPDFQLRSSLDSDSKSKDETTRQRRGEMQDLRTIGCMKLGDILGNFISSNRTSCSLTKPGVPLQDGGEDAVKLKSDCDLPSSKDESLRDLRCKIQLLNIRKKIEKEGSACLSDTKSEHRTEVNTKSGDVHESGQKNSCDSTIQLSSTFASNKSSRYPSNSRSSTKSSRSPSQYNRPSNKSSRPSSSGRSCNEIADLEYKILETNLGHDEASQTSTKSPPLSNPKPRGKDLKLELEIKGDIALDAIDGKLKQFLKGIGGFIYYSKKDGGIPRIKELSSYFSGKQPLLWFFPRS